VIHRGQHKIFLGMAVGVGKTYRMLQEGHSLAAEGRDVAIGLLETHGRPETAGMAEGLELIPRRRVPIGGIQLAEMDLGAILRRAPAVCLIDEIAHTNAPGLEHQKRYEDVEEILAAGISVLSTINVQHLESVSQRVAETAGIAVTETMPDRIVDEAEEVAVVDLTPEALRDRIIEGKVFTDGSVPTALTRFFTKENLDVLREMALLQVVEEVEAHRLTADVLNHDDRLISNVAAEREHHFLGLVKPDPSANRIVRRAWEMSERLGGRLDLLWVAPPHQHGDPDTAREVDDLRRLAAVFGTELIVQRDSDTARAVMQAAARYGTTHIVMGVPHLRKRLGVEQRSLVDEIVEQDPTLQLALVGDPAPPRVRSE
jgi:two-component system, OmpR family, sensor histidine kinase KdpD